MCSSDRLALIAAICAKRPSLNRLNIFVAPRPEDEDEEKTLALRANDDESIIDEEEADAYVSPELARALSAPKGHHEGADALILTPAERRQIEEDRWANRRRFALWMPPRSIADLLHA